MEKNKQKSLIILNIKYKAPPSSPAGWVFLFEKEENNLTIKSY